MKEPPNMIGSPIPTHNTKIPSTISPLVFSIALGYRGMAYFKQVSGDENKSRMIATSLKSEALILDSCDY